MAISTIKNIVVGLDYSKPSKKAVDQARIIAKITNANLVYVHAFDEGVYESGGFGNLVREACRYHEGEIRRVYKLDEHDKVIVKSGKPFELLMKIAAHLDAPMIVVGRQGTGQTLLRMFMGSTAERLILNSKVPVFVHHGSVVDKFNKILIPTDLGERSPRAKEIVSRMELGSVIYDFFCVHVPPAPLLDYDRWQKASAEISKVENLKLKNFKQKHGPVILGEGWGAVGEQITKRSKKYSIIVVTPNHPKGFFRGIGRMALKIMRLSPVSVLIVP